MLKLRFPRKLPKKRYIALGILALEIASLPAAAQILDRVMFSVEPQISAVLIDDVDGVKRFAVASNSPFYVSAQDYLGEISVQVHKSGQIGNSRFGDNAQIPGAALACSHISFGTQTIYQAERKTAFKSGDILSQAVMIVVEHDPTVPAVIKIMPGTSPEVTAKPTDCSTRLS